MSGANAQILALSRQGLTAEEIAEQLGWDVSAVKMVVNNWRETAEPVEDISDDEHRQILDSLKSIALYAENESARQRACVYLIEEKKGRNERRVARSGPRYDITLINNAIEFAQNKVKRLAERAANESTIVEVAPF